MQLAVGIVVIAWATAASGFTLATICASRALARRTRAAEARVLASGALARLSAFVLLPCEGDEPGLAARIAGVVRAARSLPRPARVYVLVPTEADAAAATASPIAEAAPEAVRLVFSRVTSTRNRKCAQLAVGLAQAQADGARDEDAIVQVDSDVWLDARTLASLLAALVETPPVEPRHETTGETPDDRTDRRRRGRPIACAFAAPIELAAGARPTLAELSGSALLSASHHDFHALAALDAITGGAPKMAGPLVAHRLAPLVAAGGFAAHEPLLGEDMEQARRLHERGFAVALAARPAVCAPTAPLLAAVLARTTRWLMVARRQRPALFPSYPLLLAPTPILAALVLALGPATGIGCGAVAAVLALVVARVVLARTLRAIHGAPVSLLRAGTLFAVGELLVLGSFARALVARDVVWRGHRLRVRRGGAIERVP